MGTNTADMMDDNPAYQSCAAQFSEFGAVTELEGRIRTVRCDGDTVLVKQVLAEPGAGQVLIIDGGGSLYSALLGDRVAALAAEQGWAGVVVYGAVRDVAGLRRIPMGIKALGTNPRKPGQAGTGTIDCDVTFGGVTFRPGAPVWGDEDGLITMPLPEAGPENTDEVGYAGRRR